MINLFIDTIYLLKIFNKFKYIMQELEIIYSPILWVLINLPI
jgi:hypothetical protein